MAHPIKLKDMQKKSNLIPITGIGCSSKKDLQAFQPANHRLLEPD